MPLADIATLLIPVWILLGLLLLLITAALNILGRWLIGRPRKAKTEAAAPADAAPVASAGGPVELPPPVEAKPAPGRRQINAWVNVLMTGVLGLCLAFCLLPLFLILGYITYRGVSGLNLAFFTELPRTVGGVPVGGLRHALIGSAILVALACATGASRLNACNSAIWPCQLLLSWEPSAIRPRG